LIYIATLQEFDARRKVGAKKNIGEQVVRLISSDSSGEPTSEGANAETHGQRYCDGTQRIFLDSICRFIH
jgi:hypothetical protein